MIEELLKSGDFTDTLRSIAQKRRQGVLEVKNEQQITRIYFVAGRIVDVDTEAVSSARDFLDWLEQAGLIVEPPILDNATYEEVFEALMTQGGLLANPENFKFLIEERVLDRIHFLKLGPTDNFYFSARIVANVSKFNPKISVGQYLLDLVALAELHERFAGWFSHDPTFRLIKPIPGDTPEVRLLTHAFERGGRFNQLIQSSGLSSFHFLELFQSLMKDGLIAESEQVEPEVPKAVASAVTDESQLERFDDDLTIPPEVEESWEEIELIPDPPAQVEANLAAPQPTVSTKTVPQPSPVTPVLDPIQPEQVLKPQPSIPHSQSSAGWKVWNARLLQSIIIVQASLLLFLAAVIFLVFTRWAAFLQPFDTL